MSIAELLLPEWDIEMATTRKVLERVPDDGDKGSWKPHEKSFPLAHLAQLCARLPGWVAVVIDRDEVDIAPKEGPSFPGYSIEKTATLLAEFERNAAQGRELIARTSDETFAKLWSFKAAGNIMFTQTKYLALRTSVINHTVHHRAQLGVYLRLLNEKVPSMYGPTADDRAGMPANR